MKNGKIYMGILMIASVSFLLMTRFNKEVGQHLPTRVAIDVDQLNQLQKTIIKALEEGDVSKLAAFFEEEISLIILSDRMFYSRAIATKKFIDFFKQHRVQKFVLQHEGTNLTERIFYLIGELETHSQEKFRIYIASSKKQIKIIEITLPVELSS